MIITILHLYRKFEGYINTDHESHTGDYESPRILGPPFFSSFFFQLFQVAFTDSDAILGERWMKRRIKRISTLLPPKFRLCTVKCHRTGYPRITLAVMLFSQGFPLFSIDLFQNVALGSIAFSEENPDTRCSGVSALDTVCAEFHYPDCGTL